jgi:heterodisulfide reductase subunit D
MEEKEKDLDQAAETKEVEATERAEKIEEKANKLMEEKQIQSADSIDVLYYAGCTASYDINVKEVGINTLNILDALGIKFGILGTEEKCCGSPFLRIGDYEFERLAEYNIRLFNSLNVKMLITACAGCYRTIGVDYKKMGTLNMEVLHISQLLLRLIKEKKIELKQEVLSKVTYHLGRHSMSMIPPGRFLKPYQVWNSLRWIASESFPAAAEQGGDLKQAFLIFKTEWLKKESRMQRRRARNVWSRPVHFVIRDCK